MTISNTKLTEGVWAGPHWETHPAGKNYLAKIAADENQPSGYERIFQPKSKGRAGFVWRQMAPGDPFEIGSTGVEKGGKATRNRTWGVIHAVDSGALDWVRCDDAQAALKLSRDMLMNVVPEGATVQVLQRRARDLMVTIANAQKELNEVRAQIKSGAEDTLDGMGALDPDQMAEAVVEALVPDVPSLPEVKEKLPDKARRLLTPTPVAAADDDDEDGLTPGQIAALGIRK